MLNKEQILTFCFLYTQTHVQIDTNYIFASEDAQTISIWRSHTLRRAIFRPSGAFIEVFLYIAPAI